DKVLVVVNGKFDVPKIQTTLEMVAKDKGDLKITKLGGKTVYESSQQGKTAYSSFLDGSTLIVSTNKGYLTDAVEGKTGKINKDPESAIAGVDAKQSLWIAGTITEEMKKAMTRGDSPAANVAPKLKAVTGGVTVTDGVAVAVQVKTTEAKAAKELSEFIDQAKGLLAFVGQSNEDPKPFVADLLKTLKVRADDTDVKVNFQFSADTVEKAIKKIPKK